MALTLYEATEILNKHLPVVIDEKLQEKLGKGPFYIHDINTYKHIHDYNGEYVHSAGISTDGRCVVSLELYDVSIAPEYEPILSEFMKRYKKDIFKSLIEELVAAGCNEATITSKVKKIIDEIRAEQSNRIA